MTFKQLPLAGIALSALILSACAGNSPNNSSANVATAEDIKDGLSTAEFRAYGNSSPTTVNTRLGELNYTVGGFAGGYPTLETIDTLRNELSFQQATQSYLWAVPIVSYHEWQKVHENTFHANDGQIVQYPTALAKQGILTANATTPYAIIFADLERTGPLVFEVPAGPSAGIIDDMFQRQVRDFGVSGPERGKGAKFIIIAPGMEAPSGYDKSEYVLVQNTTRSVFMGIRALQADPADADAFLKKFKTYPYTDVKNPKIFPVIVADDNTPWGQWQQHGMAYWDSVKEIVDRESFEARDGYILAMLKSLGIEKDVPFEPSPERKKLLKEAAVIGEGMVKSLTFDKPFSNNDLYKGTHWDQLMVVNYNDKDRNIEQMYRRAAFTWEAVSRGKAYYLKMPGLGQQYRTAYKDADGNFFEGSNHYTLTMPKNQPAKTFWSIVVYDVNTRTLIMNDAGSAIASSRTGLKEESDGSIVIHFSPSKPRGVKGSNWIQTNADESWFTYLRFYGPTEAYFDESYPLEDIKKVGK